MVARQPHKLEVAGSSPARATSKPLMALVESTSEPGKLHRVTLAVETDQFIGESTLAWRCDCRGFWFGLRRHLRPECRHVRAVKMALEDGLRELQEDDRDHP